MGKDPTRPNATISNLVLFGPAGAAVLRNAGFQVVVFFRCLLTRIATPARRSAKAFGGSEASPMRANFFISRERPTFS
jgi:hypothetical protein